MPTLVSDIIQQSFNDLGVTKSGELISPTMQLFAFALLNQYWSSLSAEPTMAYLYTHQSFNLTGGTTIYTLGVGGSLNTAARPVRVTGWTSASGNFRNGGRIISFEELHALAKNATAKRSVLAEAVAADMAFPLLNLEVFPPPDAGPGSLILDYWTPLVPFATVADALNLPPGFEAFLHFNLAIQLAPQYARQGGVPAALAADAANSKKVIMDNNAAILGLVQAQPAQQGPPQGQ
jgi:hypothetical protein